MMNKTTITLVSAMLLGSTHVMPASAAWPFMPGSAQQSPSGPGGDGNPVISLLRECGDAPGTVATMAGRTMQAMFPFVPSEPAHVDAGEDLDRSCPTDSGQGGACLFQNMTLGQ